MRVAAFATVKLNSERVPHKKYSAHRRQAAVLPYP